MTGARVVVAEEYRVGGTCVVRGCVPKKLMVYASGFKRDFELARGYGWTTGETSFDWNAFLMAKEQEIARLSGVYTSNLTKAGADILYGTAKFLDPHTLEVKGERGTQTVTAAKVLIAAGGRPSLPSDVPGVEHVITSEEAFHLPELPKRMVIVGGGYIAIEFACIFHGLGVDVTLMYRGPNLLRGFDEDVRSHLADELRLRGFARCARLPARADRKARRRRAGQPRHRRHEAGVGGGDVRHRPRAACEDAGPGDGRG